MEKSKNTTINRANKKNKYFQYALTVALNHEEVLKYSKRITKIKSFINNHIWEGINFQQKNMIRKSLRRIIEQLLLMFCMLKRKKYILPMFQNITQIVKNKLFF